jgi:hypothetical protein
MQPSDLNLTIDIIGHQRYLFLQIPRELQGPELARRIDDLGRDMRNQHDAAGSPSKDALRRGSYQLLRGQPERSSPRDIDHPALLEANLLIRLESSDSEPLLQYETELRQGVEPLGIAVESLAGVQRPRSYTSHALDPVRICGGSGTRTGGATSPGCGNSYEQDPAVVGPGLDAS